MLRLLMTVVSLTAISACSSVPKTIQSAPSGDVQLTQVLQAKSDNAGKTVRWGGEIIKVENKNDASLIQITQYPLNHYGRPITSKKSLGRFLARTPEFFDPVVYKAGTLITFSGKTTAETQTRKVDEKQLLMPVIDITDSYRWQPRYYGQRHSDFYGDPFFSPYNSFYYNRWYGNHWYGSRFGYRYYYW
ncbi:Starvation lipoprotein Slp-like protein [Methylophaga frappieri]|uniref:Starvation lipoprotein Slp-like protein n=1 Tax=Methylophaga frappieri (strain ATCC BAA-2434 / DSM 25690 / JAM7) TaxID=754477 RepID=I1YKW1_METFJ|nr:Slp family lipoprotein [Methylophaga frappieri]AFJ03554.1 Starvation lipoprotein Slp-like protein [Methylophaga frappieri]